MKKGYVEQNGIFGNSPDYACYHMTAKEKIVGFLIFGVGSFAAVQIFFGYWIVSLICFVIGGFFGIGLYKKRLTEKRYRYMLRQFRDMLESLSSSLGSGKNVPDAFRSVTDDLKNQYGADADIVNEAATITMGLNNNVNLEVLLSDFAARSHSEDIENFSDVFRVANRMGGNIRQIVYETKEVLSQKMNTEFEIQTMISGKKNELNIMIILPFIVVTQIQGIQGGNLAGAKDMIVMIAIKLVALVMFAVAYVLGQKIMKIDV